MNDKNVVLSLQHITKKFGKLTVLDDMSLDVHEHEIVVLCGPSGGGKSTLLRTINGLEKINGGEIYYRGNLVTHKTIKDVRSHIGMVFQSFNLFENLTVRDNLIIAPTKLQKKNKEETIKKAQEYLDTFGIGDKMDSYPHQLSGGQKQRVAIAGVIAMEPKCIVLDEPTAMLDPNGRREVIDAVEKLQKKKNVTVILITHYMEEVTDADQVFVMDDGHIVMHGTPREIFSRVDELKRYRMDVPQVTMLAEELRNRGLDLPRGILRREELVEALCQLS